MHTDNEKIARALEALKPFAIAYARLQHYGGVGHDSLLYADDDPANEESANLHQLHAAATEFGVAEDQLLQVDHLRSAAEAYTQLNGSPAHAQS